jgi:hypothetical protein
MIIFIDAKKLIKFKISSWLKTLIKLGIEETHLNVRKSIHDRSTGNLTLNGGKVKNFPLKLGIRQGCPLLTALVQYSTGSSSQVN